MSPTGFKFLGALICALFVDASLIAQPVFRLTLDAPAQAQGEAGHSVDFEAAVLLRTASATGPVAGRSFYFHTTFTCPA